LFFLRGIQAHAFAAGAQKSTAKVINICQQAKYRHQILISGKRSRVLP